MLSPVLLLAGESCRKIESGWAFYWGELPGYTGISQGLNPVSLTGILWTPLKYDGSPPPGERLHIVWYRLILPETNFENPSLYFENEIMGKTDFYMDGRHIYSSPYAYTGVWHIVRLPVNYPGKMLFIRVESARKSIGIYGDVWIGPEGGQWVSVINRDIFKFIFSCILIALGLFIGSIQFLLPKKNDYSYLSFALFAIILGGYILSKSDIRIMLIPVQTLWSYLELMTLSLVPGIAFMAFYYTFQSQAKPYLLRISQGLVIGGGVIILLDLIRAVPLIVFLFPFQILIVAGGITLLVLSIRFAVQGHTDAKIYSFGFGIMCVYGIYNVLTATEVIPFTKSSVYYGVFFFTLSFVIIFIRRFLSVNRKISLYNTELEEQVKKRTDELIKSNRQLLRTTEAILKELMMAKRVQEHFIPDDTRFPSVNQLSFGSKYEALESVGGDLYDVIQVGKNGYGFLIADVSGHGVASALISGMIKVDFFTHSRWGVAPSDVIMKVNKDIYNFIGDLEYFVTAYYAILNLETGILHYTNAGHQPAILLRRSTGEARVLNTPGTIIGSFVDFEWKSESLKLEKGDRILFYTDGIVEARSEKKELWGYDRLMESILKNIDYPVREFVDRIIVDIGKFCGEQPADDDRALFCVEYNPDGITETHIKK
jgi:serine phosphatase RsbU (regulator of sigma subunit)